MQRTFKYWEYLGCSVLIKKDDEIDFSSSDSAQVYFKQQTTNNQVVFFVLSDSWLDILLSWWNYWWQEWTETHHTLNYTSPRCQLLSLSHTDRNSSVRSCVQKASYSSRLRTLFILLYTVLYLGLTAPYKIEGSEAEGSGRYLWVYVYIRWGENWLNKYFLWFSSKFAALIIQYWTSFKS